MGSDFHLTQLERHCRICAKILTNKQYKYKCTKFSDSLLQAFKVEVNNDQPDTHPPSEADSQVQALRQEILSARHQLEDVVGFSMSSTCVFLL